MQAQLIVRNLRSVGIALAVLAAYFPVALYLRQEPSHERRPSDAEVAIKLRPPFGRNGTFANYIELKQFVSISDDMNHLERSPVRIYENGRALAPAHSHFKDIREFGAGRFSHWGNSLVFSSSDNSDPNVNGRTYWVIIPRTNK